MCGGAGVHGGEVCVLPLSVGPSYPLAPAAPRLYRHVGIVGKHQWAATNSHHRIASSPQDEFPHDVVALLTLISTARVIAPSKEVR